MPGNIVQVNGSKDLEWYVGDSKMPKLVEVLNDIGFKQGGEKMENVKFIVKREVSGGSVKYVIDQDSEHLFKDVMVGTDRAEVVGQIESIGMEES